MGALQASTGMKQASWVINPSSRAIFVAVAALLTVSCVILVISTDEQEIVASGTPFLNSRLRKAASAIGKVQRAPRTQNMQIMKSKKQIGSEGSHNGSYGVWKKNKNKRWSTLKANLVDLKAFAEVIKDNILDMNEHD